MTSPSSGGSSAVPGNKSNAIPSIDVVRKENDEFRKKFDDSKIYISLELAKRDIGFLNILISKIIKFDEFEKDEDHSNGEVTIQALDIAWEIYDNNEGDDTQRKKELEMSVYKSF